MSLGHNIREQRKKAGMSQEKLAELVGVSRQAVTKWEADLSAPNTENLFSLAEIFGTTVHLLMDIRDDAPSQSEQTYYQYKIDEAKKAAELRCKRNHALHNAVIVTICYLPVIFTGWLISGGSGGHPTMLAWLSYYYPLLIALALSILSALLGRPRLSAVTLAACTVGLILGSFLGRNYTGPKYSMSYYGWALWGAVMFVSFVSELVRENLFSRKGGSRPKRAWVLSGILLTITCLMAVFFIRMVPKYSQPEYNVRSYRGLMQVFSGASDCLFLREDQLPGNTSVCTVYLQSRFSNKKTGYGISLMPQAGLFDYCSITCRLVNSHPDSPACIQAELHYNGTAIALNPNEVMFEHGAYQYSIHFTPISDSFSENALSLAKAMIDSVSSRPRA